MTVKKMINGATTLVLAGRIDAANAPILEAEIAGLADTKELILDFSGVEYISSAGLRVVLKMQKFMKTRGTMKLVNLVPSVMEIFEITGIADVLSIE